MAKEVILIDAGTGNLRSVHKALESLGAAVTLTSDPQVVRAGAKVILPGVGAFGDFMQGLRSRGLEEAVVEIAQSGRPLLGICVGMQALFEIGEEMGRHQGLGLLPGKVVRFSETSGLKIPHTGWNKLEQFIVSSLWVKIPYQAYAYFNHSFYCLPARQEDVSAWTEYGLRFASAVARGSLYGVQFHPEKSQRVGLQLLDNFLSI